MASSPIASARDLSAWRRLFVGGRVLASGVRLFIAALALAAVSDVPILPAILACGIVAGIYTTAHCAVVWTDVLQGTLFVVAAMAMLVVLDLRSEGGLAGVFPSRGRARAPSHRSRRPALRPGDGRWASRWSARSS